MNSPSRPNRARRILYSCLFSLTLTLLLTTTEAAATVRQVTCAGGTQCKTLCTESGSNCGTSCASATYTTLERADACTDSGDTIELVCTGTGDCEYDDYIFSGVLGSKTRNQVKVVSTPLLRSKFISRKVPGNNMAPVPSLQVAFQADYWIFDGIAVDGRREAIINNSTVNNFTVKSNAALIISRSDHVVFSRGKVSNSIGNCIEIANLTGSTHYAPVYDTFISESEISHCLYWTTPALSRRGNAQQADASGIYTGVAHGLLVRGNTIHHVSGDSVQLDVINASIDVNSDSVPDNVQIPGLWANVLIEDNHLYTSPLAELNCESQDMSSGSCPTLISPGENGIDVKPGKGPVTISRNTLSGFRGRQNSMGLGTSDSQGDAIIIHGRMTQCAPSSNGPPAPVPEKYCALVEGNDISDSNTGINLGHNRVHVYTDGTPSSLNVEGSAPRAIFVRNNIIHDLSSDAAYEMDPRARGIGIRVSNRGRQGGAHQVMSDIVLEHNTVANTPGVALHQDPREYSNIGTGTNSCSGCSFNYNLLAAAGALCNQTYNVLGSFTGNLCSPAPSGTPAAVECSGSGNAQISSPGFVNARSLPSGFSACGAPNPNSASTTPYDYSLLPSSAAINHISSHQAPGHCGSRSDTGAIESDCPFSGFQTRVLPEINPGADWSSDVWISHIWTLSGELYYVAWDLRAEGPTLFRTNGTSTGTHRVTTFAEAQQPVWNVMGTDNSLYFFLGANSDQIWTFNGSMTGVTQIPTPTNHSAFNGVSIGSDMYYLAPQSSSSSTRGLWKIAGTAAPVLVSTLSPDFVTRAGTNLFMKESGNVHVLDTTATSPTPQLLSFPAYTPWLALNNQLITTSGPTNFASVTDMWRTDGTSTGGQQLLSGFSAHSSWSSITTSSHLYFVGAYGSSGYALWKTDGTAPGTVQVDTFSGTFSHFLGTVGNTVYFSADHGSGYELWKTDGTAAGTGQVKDIRPGPASSYPGGGYTYIAQGVTIGNVFYFVANDGATNPQIWRTDGTSAGTLRVTDFKQLAGNTWPLVRDLTVLNGELYFVGDNWKYGREMHKLTCQPITCTSRALSCGMHADGCGGTLYCGPGC